MTNAVLEEPAPILRSLLHRDATARECFDTLVCFSAHQRAGDLFCTAERGGCRLTFRRDGMLQDLGRASKSWGKRLVSYAKVEARIDTAEHRRPQDGRIMVLDGLDPIDVRMNVLPTYFGEDLALRILDRRNHDFSLDRLGLSQDGHGHVLSLMRQPHGLVLVSGSIGTGKTTTLYSILSELTDGTRKINTLENPIEFDLPGVHQTQIDPLIGQDFSDLLPAVMRQDPDVIMVGEVRDPETATIAVRAAVAGQLVFATLHATRAAGAIQSMLGLGAHPHLLAGAMRGVIAQNLVRCVCTNCVESLDTTIELSTFDDIRHMLPPDVRPVLHQGRGCEDCSMTGYDGRTALFEVLICSQEIRPLIERAATPDVIEAQACKAGMIPLRSVAKLAVSDGVTTLEEVMRVLDMQ